MNVKKRLHLISFTVPYPPTYGGVIDIWNKIKALHAVDIEVILHCFTYDRPPQIELEQAVHQVYYYPRRRFAMSSWISSSPYIVASRRNAALLKRIQEQPAPILMEGEHSTAYLGHPALMHLPRWVRIHNREDSYYLRLAAETQSITKRWYYLREARKLQRHTQELAHATGLLCISQKESSFYQTYHDNVHWLPAFVNPISSSPSGKSIPYLYHGDCTIIFNQQICQKLCDIFQSLSLPLTVAGRMKNSFLRQMKARYPNIRFISNVGSDEMAQLLSDTKTQLVFAQHREGVKLKLIHAALSGGRVIANPEAVEGSGLAAYIHDICAIEDLPSLLTQRQEYTEPISQKVAQEAAKLYNPITQANKLKQLIFS